MPARSDAKARLAQAGFPIPIAYARSTEGRALSQDASGQISATGYGRLEAMGETGGVGAARHRREPSWPPQWTVAAVRASDTAV